MGPTGKNPVGGQPMPLPSARFGAPDTFGKPLPGTAQDPGERGQTTTTAGNPTATFGNPTASFGGGVPNTLSEPAQDTNMQNPSLGGASALTGTQGGPQYGSTNAGWMAMMGRDNELQNSFGGSAPVTGVQTTPEASPNALTDPNQSVIPTESVLNPGITGQMFADMLQNYQNMYGPIGGDPANSPAVQQPDLVPPSPQNPLNPDPIADSAQPDPTQDPNAIPDPANTVGADGPGSGGEGTTATVDPMFTADPIGGGGQDQNGDGMISPWEQGGREIEDAMFDRAMRMLNPQLESRERQLRQRLSNQGIPVGAEGYNTDMTAFEDGRNTLMQNAADQAVIAGTQEEQRLFQNYMTEQAFALDELTRIGELELSQEIQRGNLSLQEVLGMSGLALQERLGLAGIEGQQRVAQIQAAAQRAAANAAASASRYNSNNNLQGLLAQLAQQGSQFDQSLAQSNQQWADQFGFNQDQAGFNNNMQWEQFLQNSNQMDANNWMSFLGMMMGNNNPQLGMGVNPMTDANGAYNIQNQAAWNNYQGGFNNAQYNNANNNGLWGNLAGLAGMFI